jgi:hypothetical protein
MAAMKTRQTAASVSAFLDTVENEQRRADCRTVLNLMRAVTGKEPNGGLGTA